MSNQSVQSAHDRRPARHARDIDLTSFSKDQLDLLTQAPGPLRHSAKQELVNRGNEAEPPVQASPETAGEIALSLLTPKQKNELDELLATYDATKKVEQTVASLQAVTQQVIVAAEQAQQVLSGAPQGVDTSALEAAVAVVQPVIDAVPSS